jgi:hypothetical protein
LSLCAPLVLTLLRAAPGSDWRDDQPALSGLGLLPLGSEGWLSLLGSQLANALPFGGRWLRAAWVQAFALSLVSRLLFGRAQRLLAANHDAPRLTPLLALAASLTAVLSPTFQLEGTIIGGATLGTLAALLTLSASERLPARDVRSSLVLGALFALTAVESHAAALALVLALLVRGVARRRLPDAHSAWFACAGAASVVGLMLVGLLGRSLAPSAWLDLGLGLGQSSLLAAEVPTESTTALSAWLAEVGVIPFALALAGISLGLLRRVTRLLVLPLFVWVLLDLALPAARVGILSADPFGPTRLLAVSALGLGAALGVQAAALALLRTRLPFTQPAAVLLVVFDFTLVFVGSEASAAATERRDSVTTEVWTDEGLASLPQNALVLARSEAVAWRLWSAQLVRGERPDVVVVPTALLERGGLRRRLLAEEPALAPLLRDMALAGKPGEYALSTLSDARPLFVELDQGWDERLNEHIVPQSFWLRFRANPVGRSDRNTALARAGRRFDRVIEAVAPDKHGESARATRAVVVAGLRQRALFLAARRDRETALDTAAVLERLVPGDDVASRVRADLAQVKPLPNVVTAAR